MKSQKQLAPLVIMNRSIRLSFELLSHGDNLHIRASSPFGEANADVADTLALDKVLLKLEEENLLEMPSTTIKRIGSTLYKTLFAGKVSELGQHVLQEGIRQKRPAQLEVRFDPEQVKLAKFPWEMITDNLGRLIIRDGIADLTRYVAFPQPPPHLRLDLQNPLLRVISSPKGLAKITTLDIPLSKIHTLEHASYNLFVQKILIEKFGLWGLHFDGHGAMMLRCERCNNLNFSPRTYCEICGKDLQDKKEFGALAFENETAVDWISADEIGAIMYNANIQFALLLACESGNASGQYLFNGLAPNLILSGVPAVIGMQFPIYDAFANHFARYFYTALLQGKNIVSAMRVARQASVKEAWYSPVLYLRHQPEEPEQNIYHNRKIDTTTPASVKLGIPFLAKLWIRRPETLPTPDEQLRRELGINGELSTQTAETDIGFRKTGGRQLRKGDVEIRLSSPFCEIFPKSIRLFISEYLDAPPAMFTVISKKTGRISLTFSLWQDNTQIASTVHPLECAKTIPHKKTAHNTFSLPVVNRNAPDIIISNKELSKIRADSIFDQIIITKPPSKINVTLTDQAGGKLVTAELPTDVTINRLIPALASKMGLPSNTQYKLQHKEAGKNLKQRDTLASAGIEEGDTLRLLPDVTAGCFLGKTAISLPNKKNIKIEKLKEGKTVLAYDLEQNELIESKIKRVYTFTADEYYVINDKLNVTGSHPIYANKLWTMVAELEIGDILYDQNLQPIRIFNITKVSQSVHVYNLELLDTHVFFADGLLVHNVSIKVTITDQAAGKMVTAELPADTEIQRLVPALVSKMSLPTNSEYRIQHKQSGKQLQPGDTLASMGIKEGDTLRLLPDVRAGCFLSGTEIALSGGESIKIEKLRAGDKILAYNLEKSEQVVSEIKRVYRFSTDEYYIIDYKLGITGSHPIYADKKWTTVDNLKIGDNLYDKDMCHIKIYDIVKINQHTQVFNLELSEHHVFFADGRLVHNVHITVNIVDEKTGKTLSIALPSGVDIEHYINSVTKQMGLSEKAYIFYSKNAGGKIDLRQSLFKVGIKNGDTLTIKQ
jgi:uncharacterized ubiquitin-like protein YukD